MFNSFCFSWDFKILSLSSLNPYTSILRILMVSINSNSSIPSLCPLDFVSTFPILIFMPQFLHDCKDLVHPPCLFFNINIQWWYSIFFDVTSCPHKSSYKYIHYIHLIFKYVDFFLYTLETNQIVKCYYIFVKSRLYTLFLPNFGNTEVLQTLNIYSYSLMDCRHAQFWFLS